jgi:CheY-like chemotaxis protein/anti-sigma regulatory factor (Ser/Thr protein kinase)
MQEQSLVEHPLVLIVEDDPDTQAFLQTMLELEGYQTMVAGSGAAALQAMERVSVDVMLLDVMLPDMTGYEVCAQIKAEGGRTVPVLMMSALGQPHDVVRGLERGADDYLRKPFVNDELLARMHNLLRQRFHLQTMQNNLRTLQQERTAETTLRHEFLHNVATHMRALCGIVDAELRKLPPGAERETLQRLRSRVYGAALVYQTSEALNSDPVPMEPLIDTIATSLKAMYRPWRRVLVDVQGGNVVLPSAVAAPLAMVVNELVTNCFKHAFPNNSFGNINVTYKLDNDAFALTVADNGVGFDPEQPSAGAGRGAIRQLIGSVGGTVQWQNNDPGTRVTVRVPVTG